MKKTYLFPILLILAALPACDFGELNVDPTRQSDAGLNEIQPSAIAQSARNILSIGGRVTGTVVQHFTGIEAQPLSYTTYLIDEQTLTTFWETGLYVGAMKDCALLVEKAQAENQPNYEGIAKVLMAFNLGIATSYWGDVPYSQALQGTASLKSPYDTQEAIDQSIQQLLDEAIAAFGAEPAIGGPAGDDLIFGGDMWGEDESVPSACAMNQNRFVVVAEEPIVLDPVCYGSCNACSGVFTLTFRVDMREQDVSPDGVHIAGNFQGWDPGATPMEDSDGDGIWKYSTLLGGNTTYQYKFINGNAWGFDETVPAGCAQDNNRFVELGTSNLTTSAFCFGSCDVCEVGAVDYQLMNSLQIFPNPNDGRFTASFGLPGHREMTVNVYNPMGQLLQTQSRAFPAGHNLLLLEVGATGLLFVEFVSNQGSACRLVVVQ